MKPKTMILMVVAVGCGLGASYMTSRLLAERGKQPDAEPTVPVLVARARVPGWQPVKDPEKLFELKSFPQSVAPPKALGSFADLKDQRLNKHVDPGKPITADDLLTKEQMDLAQQLLPGQRAFAIKVNTESLVGGFVLPGSRVDVVCTTRGNDPTAKTILQNMLIMAVDTQDTRTGEQKSIIGQTVTMAATPEEAARLALGQTVGELRLMLKNPGDTTRIANVVAKASDLDKPLRNISDPEKEPEMETPPAPMAGTPLPTLPEDRTPEPPPPPPPAPRVVAAKPVQKHVMVIHNGLQREKAIFQKEEDDENEGESSGTPRGKDDTREEKPAPKTAPAKPGAKPGTPAPTSAFGGKSTRTKRIQ